MKIKFIQNIIDICRNKKNCIKTAKLQPVALNSDNERDLLRKYLLKSKIYMEFGSGGSTFEALKIIPKNQGKIYSIEGSLEWFEYLMKYKFIKEHCKKNLLDFMYMNIGKTTDWSNPIEEDKKELFPNYYSILNTKIIKDVDTLLIDGRFRVACALNVIKNALPNVNILIHDFQVRDEYQILLNYLEVVEKADTLFVFKIKEYIDKNVLSADIEKYKYDYR